MDFLAIVIDFLETVVLRRGEQGLRRSALRRIDADCPERKTVSRLDEQGLRKWMLTRTDSEGSDGTMVEKLGE